MNWTGTIPFQPHEPVCRLYICTTCNYSQYFCRAGHVQSGAASAGALHSSPNARSRGDGAVWGSACAACTGVRSVLQRSGKFAHSNINVFEYEGVCIALNLHKLISLQAPTVGSGPVAQTPGVSSGVRFVGGGVAGSDQSAVAREQNRQISLLIRELDEARTRSEKVEF